MNAMQLVQLARRATRLSQVEFGKLLGVNHRHISCWERGRFVPRAPTVRLLQLILADPGSMMERLSNLPALVDVEAEQETAQSE